MSKRFILTLASMFVIGAVAIIAVLLVKGYTFSPQEGKLVGTGIISVTSTPQGASVYIDGHLATATDATIPNLRPKKYQVKITKEGFISWEKEIEVKEGLVTEAKATLFPALPTLYPLTVNGVVSTLLSPDGLKLAFSVPYVADSHARQKGGVWVWTMSNQPISFARSAQPQQIVASTPSLDFSKATLRFSPDSQQVLVTIQESGQTGEANTRNYLLPVDRLSGPSDLRDITPMVSSTLEEWSDEQQLKDQTRIAAITDLATRQIASASASSKALLWSPDETKFIAGPANSNLTPTISKSTTTVASKESLKGYKVYDLGLPVVGKDGKSSPTVSPTFVNSTVQEYLLPEALSYYWLPDSRHIILVQENQISVCDFDGSNVAVIYAGAFQGQNVFPWPDSSRLVLLTSFNTPTASIPNLFGINLK